MPNESIVLENISFAELNKNTPNLSEILMSRSTFLDSHMDVIGKYKFPVIRAVMNYTLETGHFLQGKADQSRYKAVNEIFNALLTLSDGEFLLKTSQIIHAENYVNTPCYRTCSLYQLTHGVLNKQQNQLNIDIMFSYATFCIACIMLAQFTPGYFIKPLALMFVASVVAVLMIGGYGFQLLEVAPEQFNHAHRIAKVIDMQKLPSKIETLATSGVRFVSQSINQVISRLPALKDASDVTEQSSNASQPKMII